MKYLANLWIWISWVGLAVADMPAKKEPPPEATGTTQQMTDIHDIKPALNPGMDLVWLYWLLATLAILALAVLGWWLWQKRKKRPQAVYAPPPVAPETEAYGLLDALAADGSTDVKHFYFRLSAIVRGYVERRFEIPAAEMTTEELLPQVDRLPLALDLTQALKSFCRTADPIKFAGAAVNQSRMSEDLAFARTFVRQTTQATQPEAENNEKDQTTASIEDREPKQIALFEENAG